MAPRTMGGRRALALLAATALLLLASTASAGAVRDDTYYRELGVAVDAAPQEVQHAGTAADSCARAPNRCQLTPRPRARCAPLAQIKKAYRRLALRWHPDKNPQDQATAEAKFLRISNAYQILSNAALRRVYDANGLDGSRAASGGRPGAGGGAGAGGSSGGGFRAFQFRSADSIFQDVFGDEDPFADFFEGGVDPTEADAAGGAADGDAQMTRRGGSFTEVTKTRTITRTSTVDGQQRSFSRSHSTTNPDGHTVTKRASQRNTEDGREVKTAAIEERRADGQRRYELKQMVDGEYKHYDARHDPDGDDAAATRHSRGEGSTQRRHKEL
jgi:curved DNA-binding protein CbpA